MTALTTSPAALVERTLEIAGRVRPDAAAVVLVRETSEAVLRWANSTMTTNGATTDRTVGIVLLVPLPTGGTGAGVVRLSAPDRLIGAPDDHAGADAALQDAVREAVVAAERSGPARDAAELPPPTGPAGHRLRRGRRGDLGGGLQRARRRAGGLVRDGPLRRASPTTTSPPPGSGRRPGCGAAG